MSERSEGPAGGAVGLPEGPPRVRSVRERAPVAQPLPPPLPVRRLTLLSFGFKFGPPPANYYFDVSFLKNPARDEQFNLFSRVTPAMREFVLAQPDCRRFVDAVLPLLRLLLECDGDVRVGFGCNAGRHRSAIVVEEIARRLEADDVTVKVAHREESWQ